ncbi:MAG: helix-turn-helix transcriptional regulator [Clostridia bacterium]|nr:helix-turn-helix transcriptional regulator [Clostridia bacterium]
MNYLLGEKIARARNAKKLTQEQLACRLNISRQTVSHWENDDSQPNVEMLLKLMQVLELEAGDLLKVE